MSSLMRHAVLGSSAPPVLSYATWNGMDKAPNITLSGSDLVATMITVATGQVRSTVGKSSGKWYWECVIGVNNVGPVIGVATDASSLATYTGGNATSWSYYGANGNKFTNTSGSAYGSAYATGDVIGVALDMDSGSVTFYRNNVSQGVAFTGLTGTVFAAAGQSGANAPTVTANFGASSLVYSPPSGYNAGLYEVVSGVTPTVDYLIAGAGGGGGANGGGTGGAGGFRTGVRRAVTSGSAYTITVPAAAATGVSGGSAVFDGLTSYGGGYGGYFGGAGGSPGAAAPGAGGGGAAGTYYGDTGFYGPGGGSGAPTGYSGGAGDSSYYGGGGGGSAGAGGAASGGGYGGAGTSSLITGSSATYCAGTNRFNGANPGTYGGSSQAGVVILRYPSAYPEAASTTGSPTVTVTGGYRIYKFTASGSITF